MTQTDLFEPPQKFTRSGSSIVPPQPAEVVRARARDPQTSQDAAARVVEFESGHYWLILTALRDLGPMTVAEIAEATKLNEAQTNKRTPELLKAGKVELTGESRPGPSGRQQRVWRVV